MVKFIESESLETEVILQILWLDWLILQIEMLKFGGLTAHVDTAYQLLISTSERN